MIDVQIRQGDVFRWRYTDEVLKRKEHGNNGGTTYWAVSCIVIVDEHGDLVDTWSSSGRNRVFKQEDIGETIHVEYLGNINDYRDAHESERAKYLDADCIDISHANSSRNNFYIRKDAVENEGKKRKIIRRNIRKLEDQIRYELTQIARYRDALLSEDIEYVSAIDGVSMADDSYEDEVEEG